MENWGKKAEIDEIMEQMEAQTPRQTDNLMAFEGVTAPVSQTEQVSEDIDAILYKQPQPKPYSHPMPLSISRPGLVHPSFDTDERYYDFTHKNTGMALIFNQVNFKRQNVRLGSDKDTSDLSKVLSSIGFDVKVYRNSGIKQIEDILLKVSQISHSNNDCLLVAILTHGELNGKIHACDGDFEVQELWKNFVGNNCESLIGKPKLFFVQACRGTMTDPGVLFKPKPQIRNISMVDTVDAETFRDEYYVVPTLADLLVMYSTSEGYYSFRSPQEGSWFIQTLCDELTKSPHEDLMTILTSVNRHVAYSRQSNIPHDPKVDAAKQMPNILSMLTRSLYFKKKDVKFQFENA